MPSPTSSPQRASATNYSASAKTKRSSVSRAFNLGSASQVSQASQASKANSAASVGTITNPEATAPEILGAAPTIQTEQAAPASSRQSTGGQASQSIAPLSQAPSMQAAPNSTSVRMVPSEGTTPRSSSPTAISPPSSPTSPTTAADHGKRHHTKGGLINVDRKTGALLELILSGIGSVMFIALFITTLVNNCYQKPVELFLVRSFSLVGMVTAIFLSFHSCFEERLSPGKGVLGCLVFFLVAFSIFLNMLTTYLVATCTCLCNNDNVFKNGFRADAWMFTLALSATICLIMIMVISSVVRRR